MRRIGSVLVVLAILVVGLGFYRGWFTLTSPAPAAGRGEVNINLATDTDKMKEDVQEVKEKATELTGGAKEGDNVGEPASEPITSVERP
jgi:hypothetical protein